MPQANDSFKGRTLKSVISIEADENGKLPSEIKVIPVGEWQTEPYGLMQVTLGHISQMVANFEASVRRAVPVDVDHDGGKAAGWITKLIDKGSDGLHAVVDWTKYGEELLGGKIYKLFSPEWTFDYIDPEYGTRHGATLIAGSLTNRPLFKELPLLVASVNGSKKNKDLTNDKTFMILLASEDKSSTNMNTADILKKPVAERTEEEVKFLSEATDLTDEQKSQVETETAEAEKVKADADAAEAEAKEKEEAEAKEAAEKAEAEKKANEGKTETIEANELSRLRKADEELKVAKEQMRRVATEKEVVEKFVKASDGMRIAPAFKDKVVDFIMTASESQKTAIYEILASVKPTKVEGEAGDGSNSHLTAAETIDNLITDKIKTAKEEGKTLTKFQANKIVISEHPELVDKANKGE